MKSKQRQGLNLLFAFMLLSVTILQGQTTVTIGTGTSSTYYYPVDRYYNYSVSEAIYLASEIGQSGNISHINYYKASADDGSSISALKVYLKQTTSTSLSDGTYSTSGYTLVFDGTLSQSSAAGWKTIALASNFTYSNTSNLQILLVHNYQAYTSNYPLWQYTTSSPAKNRYAHNDNILPTSLYATTGRPNIQIVFACNAPIANAGSNKSYCINGSAEIGGSPAATGGSGSGYTYAWSPATGLNNTAIANPTCNTTVTTTYTLTVTDGTGCASGASTTKVYVDNPGNIYSSASNATYYASGGYFYDSGGSSGSYAYNENYTVTIYPCGSCKKVQLAFTTFDLESSSGCSYDWLKIYNGPDVNSTLIGTYCGTTSPGTVSSSHNTGALTIVFRSDASITGAGWAATISNLNLNPTANAGNAVSMCSGSNATIGGSPSATGGSGNYTYAWSPTTGLSASNIANPVASPSESTTYSLTVTDGNSCISSASSVNVSVSSSNANTEYLINGNKTYYVDSGKLYDSGGPSSSYSYNENYTITLYPCQAGKNVKLAFTSFDLEYSATCSYDNIKIYNGPNTSSTLLGTWCGTSGPGNITSTHATGALTIVMVSDGSITGSGLSADISNVCYGFSVNAGSNHYTCQGKEVTLGGSPTAAGSGNTYTWSPATGLNSNTVANPVAAPATTTTYYVTATSSSGCTASGSVLVHINSGSSDSYSGNTNRTIYASSGKFYDSGGPTSSYTFGEHYIVTFYPCDTNHYLKFIFSAFDVEQKNSQDCYDWLKIYNGPSTSSTLITTICGQGIPGPYTSSHVSGALTFEFYSDNIVTYSGWAADFVSVCKRIPVADAGSDKGICPGKSITIGTTQSASGGAGSPYTYSWSPSAGLNATNVANPIASPSSSSTYNLVVTDAIGCSSVADAVNVSVSGASSVYLVNGNSSYNVAGGYIYDSGGSAGSYSYNQDYVVTLYPCERGKKVKLDFTLFDIEGETNCSYDYLELRNGAGISSPPFGRFCGTGNLGSFTATNNEGAITLIWHSDNSLTAAGFAAAISNVCGGKMVDAGPDVVLCSAGTAILGGAPASFGISPVTYTWSPVSGLNSSTISNPTANITDSISYILSAIDSAGCTGSDTVVIDILTDSSYTWVCNKSRIIHSNGGKFYDSGGTSSGYAYNQDYTTTFYPCSSNGKVRITFNSFDLENHASCNYDWMKIYNGPDSNSPLLGTWCGTNSPGTIYATNTTGALTVVFHSDHSITGNGWDADVYIFSPIANAGNDISLCSGSGGGIGGSPAVIGGMPPYTFTWSPSAGLSDANIANPVASPLSTTTYQLLVTDSLGSVSTDSVTVYVSSDSAVYIANKNMTYYVSGGTFYDSGGPNGNYNNNENKVITFIPCDTANIIIGKITSLDLSINDTLFVYSGITTNPANLISSFTQTDKAIFKSTNQNCALTINFKSHNNSSLGWDIQISTLPKKFNSSYLISHCEKGKYGQIAILNPSPYLKYQWNNNVDSIINSELWVGKYYVSASDTSGQYTIDSLDVLINPIWDTTENYVSNGDSLKKITNNSSLIVTSKNILKKNSNGTLIYKVNEENVFNSKRELGFCYFNNSNLSTIDFCYHFSYDTAWIKINNQLIKYRKYKQGDIFQISKNQNNIEFSINNITTYVFSSAQNHEFVVGVKLLDTLSYFKNIYTSFNKFPNILINTNLFDTTFYYTLESSNNINQYNCGKPNPIWINKIPEGIKTEFKIKIYDNPAYIPFFNSSSQCIAYYDSISILFHVNFEYNINDVKVISFTTNQIDTIQLDTNSFKVNKNEITFYCGNNSINTSYNNIYPLLDHGLLLTPNNDGLFDKLKIKGLEFIKNYRLRIYDANQNLVFYSRDRNIEWNGIDLRVNHLAQKGTYLYFIDADQIEISGELILNY